MSEYALYEDPETKQQSYRRFAPRSSDSGNFPDFKNFKFSGPEGSESLKFAVSSYSLFFLFNCVLISKS